MPIPSQLVRLATVAGALLLSVAASNLASNAAAQTGNSQRGVSHRSVSQQPHPAIARIVVQEGSGYAFGSGSLIDTRDEYGLVITNWHVVREATGPIEVVFPSGFRSEARSIKLDEDWDLAALVIWKPPVEPIAISSRAPRPGEPLTICGYGSGQYRAAQGRCTDYYAPQIGMPHELVELDVEARQGDSGGPILNAQGEIAGVLFGAGQGTTLGSFGGRVGTFLASLGPGTSVPAARPTLGGPREPTMVAIAQPAAEKPKVTAAGARYSEVAAQETTQLGPPSTPWPQDLVSAPIDVETAMTTGSGDQPFAPWKPKPTVTESDAPTVPVVASLPAPPSGDIAAKSWHTQGGPPEWFTSAKTIFAVIGIAVVMLHVVRLAT